jgi:hypothetical protein
VPAIRCLAREDHTYEAPGGIILPGITSRLRAAGLLYEFEGAGKSFLDREKGHRIHSAVQYALEGDLDESSVEPEEIGYIRAAEEFVRREDFSLEGLEVPVCTTEYGYGTRIDAVGKWRGKFAVVNWKSGPPRRVYAIQSALEALIYSPAPVERLGIHLSADGRYTLVHYTDRKDYEIAKAALTVAAWVNGGRAQ